MSIKKWGIFGIISAVLMIAGIISLPSLISKHYNYPIWLDIEMNRVSGWNELEWDGMKICIAPDTMDQRSDVVVGSLDERCDRLRGNIGSQNVQGDHALYVGNTFKFNTSKSEYELKIDEIRNQIYPILIIKGTRKTLVGTTDKPILYSPFS